MSICIGWAVNPVDAGRNVMDLDIWILCEDQARMGFMDCKFIGQHGLSLFIRAECDILFDAGPSDAYLHNAGLLGLDISTLQWIVLSHGHWDHSDGLSFLPGFKLKPGFIAHPLVFADRHKASGEFNGMGLKEEEIRSRFEVLLTAAPHRITATVWFLGQIPRTNDYESRQTSFFRIEEGRRRPDFLEDDTALAIATNEGLVVISGCAHAGICNICDHAMQVTGETHLAAVIGGFHLLDDSEQVAKTVAYFKSHQVRRIIPMHCTALPALAGFYNAFNISKLCAGDRISFL